MIPRRTRLGTQAAVLLILGLFLGSLPATPKVYAQTQIPVGNEPTGIAYADANRLLYVANSLDNTISVVNASTATVIKTIPVGVRPDAVAYSTRTLNIYVANAEDNDVTVISTATNNVISGHSTIQAGSGPSAMVISTSSNELYVADADDGNVTAIDLSSGVAIRNITVGADPTAMAYDPSNNAIYVSNSGDGTVSVIDTKGGADTVINTTQVGNNPRAVVFAPSFNGIGAGEVYVANADDNTVSVINSAFHVIKNISVGNDPVALEYAPSNKVVYVADFLDNNVTLISTAKRSVFRNVTVGQGPAALTFDPQTKDVYVANFGDNTLSVLPTFMTSAACASDSTTVGKAVRCTATVIGTTPLGKVMWSSSGTGKFLSSACAIRAGSCSVTYIPTSPGSPVTLNASYPGDKRNQASFGTVNIRVNMRVPKVAASCVPASTRAGAARLVKCTATVVGYVPTGAVVWSQFGAGSFSFTHSFCLLAKGRCSVTMTGETPGRALIQAVYGGDLNNTYGSKNTTMTVLIGKPTLSVSCASGPSLVRGGNTTCTATLKHFAVSALNETVMWLKASGTGQATFSMQTCTISPTGSCSVSITGTAAGTVRVKAAYGGDPNNLFAFGYFTVTVRKPA